MCKSIAVIGGDMRMVYLAEMLAKENNVITFGYDTVDTNKSEANGFNSARRRNNAKAIQADSLKQAINESEIIIAPIPFSKDGKNVYTEFSKNKIPLKELIQYCRGKKLVTGAISKEVYNFVQGSNVKIIDLMQNESLAVLNTIATAEGAIEVAMRRMQKTIHGSKVLILGFGRVAKVVAQKFKGLSANVTCAARKQEAFAWIEACGYKCLNINELGGNLNEYDIIINTPPALILNKEKLKLLKQECLVIDLASKPGGVDAEAASELGINFEWALALPGKVAPVTSAQYIKMIIDFILRE